jgi:hypothetical protein
VPGEANPAAQKQRNSRQLPTTPTHAEVPAGERAQVAQLIANGKTSVAVDVAKQIHKRHASPASEALLVDAYGARIRSLAERNLAAEARALFELVGQRYPASRQRLAALEPLLAARGGSLATLLAPLADPALPAAQRAEIENYVRREVTDVREIARCEALAPDHPLRAGAAAVVAALEAVTSGPAEEAPALAEISHRSPLAPWKLLVRAIAAFYRGDGDACRLALGAMDPQAAAARLVPALRALLGEKVALSPAAASLVEQVRGEADRLAETLRKLDAAFDKHDRPRCLALIREAVALCRRVQPDICERLRQHISVRSLLGGLDPEAVTAALGGPTLKSAYFWRLLARAAEESHGSPLLVFRACAFWEEFRKHAAREGWLPPSGPELAAVYLHMAELLGRLPDEEYDRYRDEFFDSFDGLVKYYRNQPPEIRALAPKPDANDFYFLSPFVLFERACKADPCPENFRRWLEWTRQRSPANAESVAWQWRIAHPDGVEPLLFLMEAAESRNALQRAFKLMQMAENLDGLHPEVRRARFRLLVSMALRHLRQKKTHLAEKEIRALEALPQAQQGDRPAFVAALGWLSELIAGHAAAAAEAAARTADSLGSEAAAQFLLSGIAAAAKCERLLPPQGAESWNGPIAAALGRACALGDDVGLPLQIPANIRDRLLAEMDSDGAAVAPPLLVALGEAALRTDDFLLAYAISAVGLGRDAAMQAEALFLRARALPPWEDERGQACLDAAAELARRQRKLDLLNRIGAWRARGGWLNLPEAESVSLSSEQLRAVLDREIAAREYPSVAPEEESPEPSCNCPVCRANRTGSLTPIEEAIAELIEQVGPENAAEALAGILDLGAAPSRRRRRRPARDHFPFPGARQ